MTSHRGKVVLVTGAGRGIGRDFALAMAAEGAAVVVNDPGVSESGSGHDAGPAQQVVDEIRAAGGKALPIAVDVTDADQLVAAVARAEAELGTVTILVNNAGIPDAQRAHKLSTELIDRVLDINVRAPFILSAEVARRLLAAKKPGRIINIASMAAFHYSGNGAALYSVSKAAVVRMTEALAVEWSAAQINVNAIAPGAFESEMMDGMLSRMGDIAQYFPRKRIGAAAQLDSTLLYLASPASDAVTGTVIRVDDGQTPR